LVKVGVFEGREDEDEIKAKVQSFWEENYA
jgi:hypothetical protein